MTAITNDHGQPTIAEPAGQIMVGLHVIALIDLLGQSSELAKWDSVPQSFPPPPEWLQAARNSWGRVLLWREEFEKRFAEFLNSLRKYAEQLAPQHPTEVRRLFDEYRETRIQRQYFSDTLIFYSQLQNEHGRWQVMQRSRNDCDVWHADTWGVGLEDGISRGD